MSTVPSIIRMNVKIPREEPTMSNMSVQTISTVPSGYQQQAAIIVDDTVHMIIDESQDATKSQKTASSQDARTIPAITIDDTMDQILKMSLDDTKSRSGSVPSMGVIFPKSPSGQKMDISNSPPQHESSRVMDRNMDLSQWLNDCRQAAYPQQQNEQDQFFDNSRLNLDIIPYDPIDPYILARLNKEAEEECDKMPALAYQFEDDMQRHVSWDSVKNFEVEQPEPEFPKVSNERLLYDAQVALG